MSLTTEASPRPRRFRAPDEARTALHVRHASWVVIVTLFVSAFSNASRAQCPGVARLQELRNYGEGWEDPHWRPLLRALRVPRPWPEGDSCVPGDSRYGLELVSYWSRSPGTSCPVVVVNRIEAHCDDDGSESLGYALLGLDARGRVVVQDPDYHGPLIVADPELPDIDGDGYSEHFEQVSADDVYGLGCGYTNVCVPALPTFVRLLSSQGYPLTDWLLESGADFAEDELRSLWERSVILRASVSQAACVPETSWTRYRTSTRRLHQDGGRWVLTLDQARDTCTGWYDERDEDLEPRCSPPRHSLMTRVLEPRIQGPATTQLTLPTTTQRSGSMGTLLVSSDELTVTDSRAGLRWQRIVGHESCDHATAAAYCASLALDGSSAWRMPTVAELRTIVDTSVVSPSIDPTAFPNTPTEHFWTSNTYSYSYPVADGPPEVAVAGWHVNFHNGQTYPAESYSEGRVRCVRSIVADPPPARSAVPASEAACPSGMVHIPGGTFEMGSMDGDEDEQPVHQVALRPYCIDTTEVTVAAYANCVRGGGCAPAATAEIDTQDEDSDVTFWSQFCNGARSDRAQHPVNCVDWSMAFTYCQAQGARLPTEAEWEFAARGNDGRTYPWGNEVPSGRLLNAIGSEANAGLNPLGATWHRTAYSDSDGFPFTAPVGSYPAGASPYGVLDLAGNVDEWTLDWYGNYQSGSQHDPTGASSGQGRVVRGGGWSCEASTWVRASDRGWIAPQDRTSGLGFRCARGVSPSSTTVVTSPPHNPADNRQTIESNPYN